MPFSGTIGQLHEIDDEAGRLNNTSVVEKAHCFLYEIELTSIRFIIV